MTIKCVTIKGASLFISLLAISACAQIVHAPNEAISATGANTNTAPTMMKPQSSQTASLEAEDDSDASPSNGSGGNLTNTNVAGALGGGLGSPISGSLPDGAHISATVDTSGLGKVPTVNIPNTGPSLFK